mmetsp:Transcript_12196/g.6089  ORF Transcript_12196/g.6089 Transcript_12196/m.6089 type:complete len:102 (-) Transcript_12196:127-432(-)
MKELIVSAALLGAMVGALIAGTMADWIGRKPTIMVSDLQFMLGSLCMCLAPGHGLLLLGRFIVGLGIGTTSTVVPMYLAECAPPHIRGRLMAINTLLVTFA